MGRKFEACPDCKPDAIRYCPPASTAIEYAGGSTIMAKTIRRIGLWSIKADRELMALSKTNTLEAIADHFQRPPATILRAAKRLGLTIKRTEK